MEERHLRYFLKVIQGHLGLLLCAQVGTPSRFVEVVKRDFEKLDKGSSSTQKTEDHPGNAKIAGKYFRFIFS